MKFYHLILTTLVTVSTTTFTSMAESSVQPVRTALASVRTLELPREVARLIENSNGVELETRALEIVRTAVDLNKSSAPLIVGSASRVAPQFAAKFSAAAAQIVPTLAAGIARAAAASAPAYVAEIASAVAKVRPDQYAQIAHEIGYAVPGKEAQVVNAVIDGLPNLKAFADSSSASITDLVASTSDVNKAAKQLGMQTDQFLTTELTPAQVEKLSSSGSVKGFASARAARAPQAPGASAPTQVDTAQEPITTPGQGRSYYRPNPRPGY